MMAFHSANFGLPKPSRSRVRSRWATDRRTDILYIYLHFIMPPPMKIIISRMTLVELALLSKRSSSSHHDLVLAATRYTDQCSQVSDRFQQEIWGVISYHIPDSLPQINANANARR